MGKLGPRLKVRGREESLVVGLFADDAVLLAESEGTLKRIVGEFDSVWKRRKSKVMVFEKGREQGTDFAAVEK